MINSSKSHANVLRLAGVLISSVVFINASATAIFIVSRGVAESIEAAAARSLATLHPIVGTPFKANEGTSDSGRNELYRGGVRSQADLTKLERAEEKRFLEYASLHPDVLSADMTPERVQGGGGVSSQAGEVEPGEGISGVMSGVVSPICCPVCQGRMVFLATVPGTPSYEADYTGYQCVIMVFQICVLCRVIAVTHQVD